MDSNDQLLKDDNFINRTRELKLLGGMKQGLAIIYGRRRIGKTSLLKKWLTDTNGLYTQSLEASTEQQIKQIAEDFKNAIKSSFVPHNWEQLFELLDTIKGRHTICIDEFPYLVASDPSLPSRVQKWLDHSPRRDRIIVLCGSSTRMMHSYTLAESSPLFGRANTILNLQVMGYEEFCQACNLPKSKKESFCKFSLVGGVAKYWELADMRKTVTEVADDLYFGFSSYMENEPKRLLNDEGITGLNPLAVLEAVGRGASKPSEIASRLGLKQTSLSKVFHLLIETGFLNRETPFGTNIRSSRSVLYSILDPALLFWFGVFSPHRSRWYHDDTQFKQTLIATHASKVYENHLRAKIKDQHPETGRYWEGDFEFDIVSKVDKNIAKKEGRSEGRNESRSENGASAGGKPTLEIIEVKWSDPSPKEKEKLVFTIETNFARSKLSRNYILGGVRVMGWDANQLPDVSTIITIFPSQVHRRDQRD